MIGATLSENFLVSCETLKNTSSLTSASLDCCCL